MTLEQYTTLKQFTVLHQTNAVTSTFIAAQLGLSPRHVRRFLAGNEPKPRVAWNKLGDEVHDYLIAEKTETPHRNCQWLAELASDRFETKVSRSTVYRVLKTAGLLEPKPEVRITRSRFEAQHCGDLVQMDTTWGYWLGGERLCLILLLDDYSRYILYGRFVRQDTAWHNMQAIRSVVEHYGTFSLLYTDNASFFKPIRHNQSVYQNHKHKEYESEITRACREVGITHITHKPYQPQSKGKIERLFGFIQERFVSEMKEAMTLEDVNAAWQQWVVWYNTRHVNRTTQRVPKERFSREGFKPLNGQMLDDIFCVKDTRKVDSCNQFSYQGVVYTIPKEKCMVAYRITLHIQPERSIRIWHNDQFVTELPLKVKD